MPIYMDVHIIPGVKASDVAEAHHHDILLQETYGCKCMTYWIDEQREKVFCLIEAPAKEVVEELHSKSHGLVPGKVIEVDSDLVESFLGRIYDPEEAEINASGLKVFHDPSFRILLVVQTRDPILLINEIGQEIAERLLTAQHTLVKKHAAGFGGHLIEHAGEDLILSFTSASKAVQCALGIEKEMENIPEAPRLGLHCGEPVQNSNFLFGDVLQVARQLCRISFPKKIAMTAAVEELVERDLLAGKPYLSLSPADETALLNLYTQLENKWQDPEFNIEDYSQAMAMSKSQLYRKAIDLFDLSPNHLLKDYRLEKARLLLKKRKYSVAQVTFDCGFTSPSYFTK
ncbi:MAG: nickel-binding protein, partial [Flavisolibacter sp.]